MRRCQSNSKNRAHEPRPNPYGFSGIRIVVGRQRLDFPSNYKTHALPEFLPFGHLQQHDKRGQIDSRPEQQHHHIALTEIKQERDFSHRPAFKGSHLNNRPLGLLQVVGYLVYHGLRVGRLCQLIWILKQTRRVNIHELLEGKHWVASLLSVVV